MNFHLLINQHSPTVPPFPSSLSSSCDGGFRIGQFSSALSHHPQPSSYFVQPAIDIFSQLQYPTVPVSFSWSLSLPSSDSPAVPSRSHRDPPAIIQLSLHQYFSEEQIQIQHLPQFPHLISRIHLDIFWLPQRG